ncbi:hypothetical protein BB561_002384 [Smittium simulii]|uniref:BRCT domain-containing protein n=1 Tax=Smittium simulii TaxID=133385 RepID=A0A2T9YQR2_9FUNG|nr:hypothetical protein BB561_002384 [Smittium simulii]
MLSNLNSKAVLLINQLQADLDLLPESVPLSNNLILENTTTIYEFKTQFKTLLETLRADLTQELSAQKTNANFFEQSQLFGEIEHSSIKNEKNDFNLLSQDIRSIHYKLLDNIYNVSLKDIETQLTKFTEKIEFIDAQLYDRFDYPQLPNLVTSGLDVTQKNKIVALKDYLGFEFIMVDSFKQSFLSVSMLIMVCGVEDCIKSNKLLNTSDYEIIGCKNHVARNGSHKSRSIQTKNNFQKLLSGLTFIFVGETVPNSPSKDELSDLILLGGGHIITLHDYFQTCRNYQNIKCSENISQERYQSIFLRSEFDSNTDKKANIIVPLCFINLKSKDSNALNTYSMPEDANTTDHTVFSDYSQSSRIPSEFKYDLTSKNVSDKLPADKFEKNVFKTALSFLWLFDSIDAYSLITNYTDYLVFLR